MIIKCQEEKLQDGKKGEGNQCPDRIAMSKILTIYAYCYKTYSFWVAYG